jgi:uncharacterized membrane protein (DUF2068 family)
MLGKLFLIGSTSWESTPTTATFTACYPAFAVSPKQLKDASVGTFVYAGLLLTEGTGLSLRKRWAEYFTIITTAGLIPLEAYEIHRHVTAITVVLLINVAIVIYLIVRVRRKD